MAELRARKVVTVAPENEASDNLIPFIPPNYTIKELLAAIPAHCFERSAFWSTAYLLRDLVFIAALAGAISQVDTYAGANGLWLNGTAGRLAKAAAWLGYWFLQGLVCTGVWVIAHECGHQAYSPSKTLNNTVGWVLHSALLVPYHSWRISHAKHHAATGHMTRDEVFVPKTASQLGIKPAAERKPETIFEKLDDLLEDAPIWVCAWVLAQQLFGWPAYLIRNASGQKWYPAYTNHFNPKSAIFDARHYSQIIMSDVGLLCTVAVLCAWARATSWTTVAAYYFIPYLLVNHWLVCITFLQHTDPMLPHYRAGEWNFQRGALCTQDRDVFNFLTHDIASTHVAHHLSSKIPHYHGRDATLALKNYLGEHYLYTPQNWLVGLYQSYKACRYVDDDDEVVFYRNAQGQAKRKVVYDNTDSGVELS